MKSEATLAFSASVPDAFRYRDSERNGRRPTELIDDSPERDSERERRSPPVAGNTTHAHARCRACDSTVHASAHDRESAGFTHAFDDGHTKTPIDFDCPRDDCAAKAGERCSAGIRSGFHSVRSALCPDPDPKCAQTMNHVTKARCKSRRSLHTGVDLNCPGDPRRVFKYEVPRGQVSLSAGEVDLLDKLVRGTLHGRSMERALTHPDMHGLRAKVNGLSAQVARRHAERGDG